MLQVSIEHSTSFCCLEHSLRRYYSSINNELILASASTSSLVTAESTKFFSKIVLMLTIVLKNLQLTAFIACSKGHAGIQARRGIKASRERESPWRTGVDALVGGGVGLESATQHSSSRNSVMLGRGKGAAETMSKSPEVSPSRRSLSTEPRVSPEGSPVSDGDTLPGRVTPREQRPTVAR